MWWIWRWRVETTGLTWAEETIDHLAKRLKEQTCLWVQVYSSKLAFQFVLGRKRNKRPRGNSAKENKTKNS